MKEVDLLEQLAIDVQPSPPDKPQKIAKINYSHDGMINLILANRGITQNRLAEHFGYSASWVSQVMSSDAFQARLAERAAEIEDPTLRASVEDSLKGLVARSMEILKDAYQRVGKPQESISIARRASASSCARVSR